MKRAACLAALAVCLVGSTAGAVASPDWTPRFATHDPLTYRTGNPLYLQFPHITPMRAAALGRGHEAFRFTPEYSNLFEFFQTATHTVRLDFEQLRAGFRYARGLTDDLTLEVEVPFLFTTGGFLDPFIQWYHDTFRFPNGGRDLFADNAFTFRVTDRTTGADLYNVDRLPLGLGDSTVVVRHSVLGETRTRPGVGWFFQTEFPTGKRSRGTGNNQLDYGLGFLLEKQSPSGRWHGFVNGAFFVNGGHANLQGFTRDEYAAFVLGGDVHLARPVALHAQIHGGTPVLANMGARAWDTAPLDLIIGFSGHHPRLVGDDTLVWQVAFAEDLLPNGPSIDFTAHLQVGLAWGRQP